MYVRPLPGVTADRLLEALRQAANRLTTARGSSTNAYDTYNRYITWSNQEVGVLSSCVSPASLDALVTTSRYWMLQSLDPSTKGPALASVVQLEIEQRLRAFEAAHTLIEAEVARFAGVGRVIVPDTNIYLHAPLRFDQLPWEQFADEAEPNIQLVVPLIVVDELDRAKRRTDKVSPDSKEHVRDRARTTLRKLESLIDDPGRPGIVRHATPTGGPSVSVQLRMEAPGHVRLADADNEIVDQTRAVLDLSGRPTSIVTGDTGMRLRARAAGLDVIDPPTAHDPVA